MSLRPRIFDRLAVVFTLLAIFICASGFDPRASADPACSWGCFGARATTRYLSVPPNGAQPVYVSWAQTCYDYFFATGVSLYGNGSTGTTATVWDQGQAVCVPDGTNVNNYEASQVRGTQGVTVSVTCYASCTNI